MFSVAVFLFIFLITPTLVDGTQLGSLVADKTKDDLFRNMGKAYVSTFGVVDTNAKLRIVLEVG